MWWGAVRLRTGQTAMVLVLAVLGALVAAAASFYLSPVASRSAAARVAAAPVADKVIQAQHDIQLNGDPRAEADAVKSQLGGLLPLPGAHPWLGLVQSASYHNPKQNGAATQLPVAYRDDFCAHVNFTSGRCPAATGEAVISAKAASRLVVAVGDTLPTYSAAASGQLTLHVVGVYEQASPGDAYWLDGLFTNHGDLEPSFTVLDTFAAPQLAQPLAAYDVLLPDGLLSGDHGFRLDKLLEDAAPKVTAAQWEITGQLGKLPAATAQDRSDTRTAVLVQLGQVVVLAWFALGLAGRFTGRDRRADAGLLLLRGSTRGRLLRLAAGQHLPPLLAGTLLGWPLGILIARLLAGRWPARQDLWPAFWWSAAAIGAFFLGALVVLVVVDVIAQRADVATLLRRVPAARHDWRSAVGDGVLVAVAAGAVYQSRSGTSGLGAIAPALVALAVGVLLARVLRSITDRAGGAAVKAGRLRAGLTAVRISRQPGADRVFALIITAVALLALTIGGGFAGREERAARAQVELGAPRVLTVAASTRTQLMYAVQTADPAGKYAMGAVLDPPRHELEIDTSRLAAIGIWRPEYGPRSALEARRPAPLPLITGTGLTLALTSTRDRDSTIEIGLQHEGTGAGTTVKFEHVHPGAQVVTTPVATCTTAPGCRIVSIELIAGADPKGPAPVGGVLVEQVSQTGPARTILDTATLGDITRWRGDFYGTAVSAAAGPAGLTLAPQVAHQAVGQTVYVVDGPLPLPAVVAGDLPKEWHLDDAGIDYGSQTGTPVVVTGMTGVVPVLGTTGTVTDLDGARRVLADAKTDAVFQVWLAADAPAGIRPALEKAGLRVITDKTVAGRAAQLAGEPRVAAGAFQLFAAGMMILLAAAMVAVAAAVERGPLREQLAALRVQGLSRRTANSVALFGYVWLAGLGLAGGLLAAVIARPLAHVTAPVFADGWNVIGPPGALGPGSLALAALAGLVVLAPVTWLSARRITR